MKEIIKNIPFAKKIYYYFKFPGECYGCFRGVFETFEEAIASAPKTKSIGYDNLDLAEEYKDKLSTNIVSYDYPVLFWLSHIFNQSSEKLTVFDFGGNVGNHFYTYSPILKYPHGLNWTVCDVPEIVKAGQKLMQDMNSLASLYFTTEFKEANGKKIFIASGSLQYVESLSLSLSLSSLEKLPHHLLINRLPLYDGKQFVSLQNGGKVFYPQYIFNREQFINSLTNIGYKLVDIWEDRVDFCIIPFHSEYSVPVYSGLYFKLLN
jgi:putative methyltransferase (TIGR04325 family)